MPDPDITLIIDGAIYDCVKRDAPVEAAWHFPVGEGDYQPERWYCSVWHDPTGARNDGYKHTGIDLNLDVSPWGDVERTLDLSIYALADGVVHYITRNWYGVPMVVIRHEHEDEWLYVRYGHVDLDVLLCLGAVVDVGQWLGKFANWRKGDGGDHLHLDMSRDVYTTAWMTPGMLDPVPVLGAHLDPDEVDAMLGRR